LETLFIACQKTRVFGLEFSNESKKKTVRLLRSTRKEAPMSDDRGDLPSASNAHRYAACPGSHRACIGLPDTTSEDAARGDRIHAWLQADRAPGSVTSYDLDGEELDVAERCKRQADELIEQHIGTPQDRLVETRLWDPSRTWSGKADLVVIDAEGRALVIDYKTGRGDVEEAVGNLQLRALAVLLCIRYMVDVVTVAIVQPLAGPPSVCRYETWDLDKASAEIDEIMAKANATNQPRNPGPWCQYCRAAGTDRCPESRANLVTVAATQASPALTTDLGRWLDAADAAEEAIANLRAQAKAILQAGGEVPGWTLKPGRFTESISDPELVAGRFGMLHKDGEEARKAFLRTVSVGKGKLEEEVAKVTGEKGKALDARIASLLDRATESKLSAPSLARVKGGQP
jgi:hypothetical protein